MAKNSNLKNLPEEEILWADKKRWLGLPWSFTRYTVDKDRLYVKKGFLKTETDELLLYRILDIKSSQTLGQRMLGVGTVTLYCSDKSNGVIELKNIKKPDAVRRFLSDIVEKRRMESGIRGREIIGTGGAVPVPPGHAPDCDLDGDGIPDCGVHDHGEG